MRAAPSRIQLADPIDGVTLRCPAATDELGRRQTGPSRSNAEIESPSLLSYSVLAWPLRGNVHARGLKPPAAGSTAPAATTGRGVGGGGWRVEGGGWRVESGGWRVESGGWRGGVGGWVVDAFRSEAWL